MENILEELQHLISVLVAVVLGFAIGYERKLGHPHAYDRMCGERADHGGIEVRIRGQCRGGRIARGGADRIGDRLFRRGDHHLPQA